MDFATHWIQIGIAVLQFLGIPILVWITKILRQMHKNNRLTALKVDTLIMLLSEDDEGFREKYHKILNDKKSDYNFVFKK